MTEPRAPRRANRWLAGACVLLAITTAVFFALWRQEDAHGQELDRAGDRLQRVWNDNRPTLSIPLPGDDEGYPSYDEPSDEPTADGSFPYTLTVHTDGCGVIRTSLGDDSNLEWTVKDEDGFQVLGRVAQGETRYRYYRPGTYTVTLTTGHDAVSNTVTIEC